MQGSDGWMDGQTEAAPGAPGGGGADEEAERGPGGGQRFTYQAALQEGCGGEGREKETKKTCEKRLRAGARAPASPPFPFQAVPAPPFLQGSSGTPPVPTIPQEAAGVPLLGMPAPARGAAEGLVGVPPLPRRPPPSPLRAFFWSLRVSEDFFLISWRARLYSGGTEVPSEGTPRLTSTAPPARIRPFPPVPFAWSLSSWLAVFFQSSILSCKGFIRLSMRALEQGERGQECGRAPEPGGSCAPYPRSSRRPASPSSEREG